MNLEPFIPFVLYGIFYLAVLILWWQIRNYLKQKEELKTQLIRKNRTVRNYEVFINTLNTQEKIELPEPVMILGNEESDLELTIFTSLYCEMCQEICETVNKIIFAYEEEIKINIFFKKQPGEDKNRFLYILHNIFLVQGTQEFLKALNFWFENKNLAPWTITAAYNMEENSKKFTSSNEWFAQNNIMATPSVFINGHIFPHEFEKEDLYYHIEGIIENKE
ncbi:thioredoxin domain-containing protein [Chryseobacterium sp. L7]|uniref:Thioredoxin domain-containing protein n=1 Tax=Chryseobacterium endalhagicum TaxID=2797638 RepID=A0ABS1QI67_9FLAO|nr:thioredoxin domain-containing protein [Chryseobacterium endalhagicum]MBL1222304.1 thioredoxin domain-containing protein [Chryseobacterium endalhagicum]